MRLVPRGRPLPVAAFGGPGDCSPFVIFPLVLFVLFVALDLRALGRERSE